MTKNEQKKFEELIGNRLYHFVYSETMKYIVETYSKYYPSIETLVDINRNFPKVFEHVNKEIGRYMNFIIPHCDLVGGFVRVFRPLITIPVVSETEPCIVDEDKAEDNTFIHPDIEMVRIFPEDINYDLFEEDKITLINIEDEDFNYAETNISAGIFEPGGTYINVCDIVSLYNACAKEETR